jgi:hypothetical protein
MEGGVIMSQQSKLIQRVVSRAKILADAQGNKHFDLGHLLVSLSIDEVAKEVLADLGIDVDRRKLQRFINPNT